MKDKKNLHFFFFFNLIVFMECLALVLLSLNAAVSRTCTAPLDRLKIFFQVSEKNKKKSFDWYFEKNSVCTFLSSLMHGLYLYYDCKYY